MELGHAIIDHLHLGMKIYPSVLVATALLQNSSGLAVGEDMKEGVGREGFPFTNVSTLLLLMLLKLVCFISCVVMTLPHSPSGDLVEKVQWMKEEVLRHGGAVSWEGGKWLH